MKKLLVTLLAIMSILPIKADEGMWMLTDLKKQNEVVMRQLGLDLSVDEIYSPDNISLKDAVIHFGSGCTGEVISADVVPAEVASARAVEETEAAAE